MENDIWKIYLLIGAADCLVHTLRLNWKCTLVVVGFSVNQKYRFVDSRAMPLVRA